MGQGTVAANKPGTAANRAVATELANKVAPVANSTQVANQVANQLPTQEANKADTEVANKAATVANKASKGIWHHGSPSDPTNKRSLEKNIFPDNLKSQAR